MTSFQRDRGCKELIRLTVDASAVVRSDDNLLHRLLLVRERATEVLVRDDVLGESLVRQNGCGKETERRL